MAIRRIATSCKQLPKPSAPVAQAAEPVKRVLSFIEHLIEHVSFAEVKVTSSYVPKNAEESDYAALFGKTHGYTPSGPNLTTFIEFEKSRSLHPVNEVLGAYRKHKHGVGLMLPHSLQIWLHDRLDLRDANWFKQQLNGVVDRVIALEISNVTAGKVLAAIGAAIAAMPAAVIDSALKIMGAKAPVVNMATAHNDNPWGPGAHAVPWMPGPVGVTGAVLGGAADGADAADAAVMAIQALAFERQEQAVKQVAATTARPPWAAIQVAQEASKQIEAKLTEIQARLLTSQYKSGGAIAKIDASEVTFKPIGSDEWRKLLEAPLPMLDQPAEPFTPIPREGWLASLKKWALPQAALDT